MLAGGTITCYEFDPSLPVLTTITCYEFVPSLPVLTTITCYEFDPSLPVLILTNRLTPEPFQLQVEDTDSR